MVKKSVDNGVLVSPFLLKCYEMVDDQSTDALISWSSTGDSFVILDFAEFESELLPKYFKHRNFSSFIRQLNIYGFRKIDTDRWEFANDQFIKGQKNLLKNICRRKHSQVMVQRNSSQQKDKGVEACEEDKSVGLWKEVESLKTDKNALMQELVKLRQHQQTSLTKLVVLREQLLGMEKNQQQMLSFIVMAMQSPGFLVQLLQPKENNWQMAEAGKSVLKQVADDCETIPSDAMIVRYQPLVDQSPDPLSTPALDSEDLLELDLSSDEVKDLFMNIDFMSGPEDEKLYLSESYGPIVLPDLPDEYSMLEQLLNKEDDCESDAAEFHEFGMETESTSFGSRLHVSDEFELAAETLENPITDNTEILTEQMGLLASEYNLKHQNNV